MTRMPSILLPRIVHENCLTVARTIAPHSLFFTVSLSLSRFFLRSLLVVLTRKPAPGTTMEPATMASNSPLQAVDPEIHDLIEKDKQKELRRIELAFSMMLNPPGVDAFLSCAITTSSYGAIKHLCDTRALQAFRLDPTLWGVDVRSYSGDTAKVAAYNTILQTYNRIMCYGGRPGNVYNTSGSKKIYFESIPLDICTGHINYDKLEERALNFRPHLIICGSSAYPRDWDYARFRSIANKCEAFLLCDMADISGLIAAQEAANPFEYCEIVTTTTNKSLRGPTAGMIFYKKGLVHSYFQDLTPVFNSLEDGPPNHQIGALAVFLWQAMSPQFKVYAKQVKANAVAVGNYLLNKSYKLVTGGTDNHLVLWDLRPLGLTGNKVEKLCDICGIMVNKTAVFGDSSAKEPKGILIGTHAMTFRGLVEKDFEQIGEFLHRAVTITSTILKQHGKRKRMKDFEKDLDNNEDIEALKVDVEKFSLLH